jgi:hypothetical protein
VRLAALQRAFWRAMREPRPSPEDVALFLGDARLPALDRLLIYRRAYWARQIEALADEFRRLVARLGERPFADLMHDYLVAHPSREHRLEWIGRDLAAFLRAHPAARYRALADLAALEWAEVEVLLAEDAPAIATGADVPAAVFPACRLEMVPALRLLGFARDPLATEGGAREVAAAPADFAVWRQAFAVRSRRLAPDEAAAARAALAGAPLAAVCEAFLAAPAPAERASAILGSWLASGWVSRIVAPPGAVTP